MSSSPSGVDVISRALHDMCRRTGCPLLPDEHAPIALRTAWSARAAQPSAFHILEPWHVMSVTQRCASDCPAWRDDYEFEATPPGKTQLTLQQRLFGPRQSGSPHALCEMDRWYVKSVLDTSDQRWSPWLGAVAAEVTRLAEDAEYFVLAERVGTILHAMCTDERQAAHDVEVVPCTEHERDDAPTVGCTSSGTTYVRSDATAPWELVGAVCWTSGFGFLVAPLCFVLSDDVMAYAACVVMYRRFWRHFHNPATATSSSDASASGDGMGPALTALTAELLSDPVLLRHLEAVNVDLAAAVAGRWFASWFAGFIPLSQVLIVLDAILFCGNAASVLVRVASGVLSMRRSALLDAREMEGVLDLLFDLGDVEVLPLLG